MRLHEPHPRLEPLSLEVPVRLRAELALAQRPLFRELGKSKQVLHVEILLDSLDSLSENIQVYRNVIS